MWGLNPQPQDQESHVPPTNPARDPKLRTFESAGNTQFLKKKKKDNQVEILTSNSRPGSTFLLCHLLSVSPQASYFMTLGLSLLICALVMTKPHEFMRITYKCLE